MFLKDSSKLHLPFSKISIVSVVSHILIIFCYIYIDTYKIYVYKLYIFNYILYVKFPLGQTVCVVFCFACELLCI